MTMCEEWVGHWCGVDLQSKVRGVVWPTCVLVVRAERVVCESALALAKPVVAMHSRYARHHTTKVDRLSLSGRNVGYRHAHSTSRGLQPVLVVAQRSGSYQPTITPHATGSNGNGNEKHTDQEAALKDYEHPIDAEEVGVGGLIIQAGRGCWNVDCSWRAFKTATASI